MDRNAVISQGAVAVAAVAALLLGPAALRAQAGDPYTIETMDEYNGGLRALWMDLGIQVEQIEALTIGDVRRSTRLHRQPVRWVPNDPRRNADGINLTYLVEQADLAASGLDPARTEAAIDSAMSNWASVSCFAAKVRVTKRADSGADPDIFDALNGYGGFGDYRLADVVLAGWMPPSFFDQVSGPGSGEEVVAFSVTFIYVGPDGQPTDLNRDGYLDTAANEIYYNEAFSWLLGAEGKGIDVESVVLHELGHSLGIGHFEAPPVSVMNPVYLGERRVLEPLDRAALCSIWGNWPKK